MLCRINFYVDTFSLNTLKTLLIYEIYYLKGTNFRGKKFSRNLFSRLRGPKTSSFAELIFAIGDFFSIFVELIFAIEQTLVYKKKTVNSLTVIKSLKIVDLCTNHISSNNSNALRSSSSVPSNTQSSSSDSSTPRFFAVTKQDRFESFTWSDWSTVSSNSTSGPMLWKGSRLSSPLNPFFDCSGDASSLPPIGNNLTSSLRCHKIENIHHPLRM